MSAKGAKRAKRDDAKRKRPDAAEIILHVVRPQVERGDLELFHTPNKVSYATVRIKDHFETYALDSNDFKDLMAHAIYRSSGEMPSDAILKKVIRQLRGEALYDSAQRAVFHRLAEANGNIYLDLCDEKWQVVEVTPTGWWLAKDPPVRFVRSSVARALPEPTPGGNLDDIFRFVHIQRRDHRVLFLAWLVGTVQTQASYPILMLVGSQGAAKTTNHGRSQPRIRRP
jgi:hypothetical protein